MTQIMTEIVSCETYQYYPLSDNIVRAICVCGEQPTFKYTRIEMTGTLERIASGENIDEVIKGMNQIALNRVKTILYTEIGG